tara:strand:+ start:148 stop:603 length:456 start_codon:yes stop_codon:yes gene_type:complete
MSTKEFIMRGKVADYKTTSAVEKLNFSGHKEGYAYKLIEFRIWSTVSINVADEMEAIITTNKTPADPASPDFSNPGTIGVATWQDGSDEKYGPQSASIVDDSYLITQDLLLTANDYQGDSDINYFCRFKSVKVSGAEAAVANYKQFLISSD